MTGNALHRHARTSFLSRADPMRWALASRSPAGTNGRLSILIFHRVRPKPDPLMPHELDAHQFERICRWVGEWFNVLPLELAVEQLRSGDLPARAMSITFDDGYADNVSVALPILRRHGLPATVFVATGFLDGGRMWNDTVIESIRSARVDELALGQLVPGAADVLDLRTLQARQAAIPQVVMALKYLPHNDRGRVAEALAVAARATLPHDLMMSSQQLRDWASGGMGVGAHTVTHPILSGIGVDAVRDEMARSRETLLALVDRPVDLFAYPNGKPGVDFDDDSVTAARQVGFRAAVTTTPGAAHRGSDLYQLPRYLPWNRDRVRFCLRLWMNLG